MVCHQKKAIYMNAQSGFSIGLYKHQGWLKKRLVNNKIPQFLYVELIHK